MSLIPISKELVASSARTTSSNSGDLLNTSGQLPLTPAEIVLILNCTSYSLESGLDVALEHSHDGGTTWTQRCAFAQLTAAGEREIRFRNFTRGGDAAAEQSVATGTGADANDGMIARNHRIAWSVGTSGVTVTATFEVAAHIRPIPY